MRRGRTMTVGKVDFLAAAHVPEARHKTVMYGRNHQKLFGMCQAEPAQAQLEADRYPQKR